MDAIRVGLPISLTGQFSSQGLQAFQGIKCWVQDANAQGGMRIGEGGKPLPVHLLYYDDESRPASVSSITRKLITEDRVAILLGPYSSSLTLACAHVSEELGMVLWNHGGASDAIQYGGFARVVSILAPASRYLHGVVELLMSRDPVPRKAAVLRSSRGSFPRTVADGFAEYAAGHGWEIAFNETYKPGEPDFRAAVERIKSCSPDVVVGVGRIQDDLALARELATADLGVEAQLLVAAGVSLFGEEMGALAEGFIGPSQWEPGLGYVPDYGPTTAELESRHEAFRKRGTDYTMAQGYAAGLAAQRCVMEAGSLERDALMEATRRVRLTTFYGPFEIDPTTGAQLGRSVPLVQWKRGRKEVVWPLT